jgi:peptidyl-tRNA hydrolase
MAEGSDRISDTISSNDVNEQFLASLIEMGIDQDAAQKVFLSNSLKYYLYFVFKALRRVNNRSLDDALAVIFSESIPATKVDQATQDIESDANVMTYKMLFIVNGSLQMDSGNIATQVAHCAIDLYQNLIEKRAKSLDYWQEYGETKIVVRGKSTEELNDIETRAKTNPFLITTKSQGTDQNVITCIGLFGTNKQLNPITGHLKLMQDCLKCHGN